MRISRFLIIPLILIGCIACRPSKTATPGATETRGNAPTAAEANADGAISTTQGAQGGPAATGSPAESAAQGETATPGSPAKAAKAQARLGELVAFQGDLSVRRAEKILKGDAIDLGFTIIPYDLLTTGPKSSAEIDLNSGYSGGVRLRVSERTSYWFDMSEPASGETKTDFRLLAGSVALKVKKLTGDERVSVSTGGSTFGVRGTEFIVTVGPEASILVTCVEGKVECSDDSGSSKFAVPGQVVEKKADGDMQALEVDAGELGAYRKTWLNERTEEFFANPSHYISGYVAQAAKRGPSFDKSVAALRSYDAIWKKWQAVVDSGKQLSMVEVMKDRQQVNKAMFAAAGELFFYENVHYRLKDMASRLANPGDGRKPVAIPADLAAIQTALSNREQNLAWLRSAFRLYSAVSEDSPLGDFFLERAGGN